MVYTDNRRLHDVVSPLPRPPRDAVAVLFAGGRPEPWVATVASLRAAHPGMGVLAGGPNPSQLGPLVAAGARAVTARSLAELANRVAVEQRSHVLLLTAPATVPAGGVDGALLLVDDDLAIATVSFLHGFAAGDPVDGDPVPVPWATGPAVVLAGPAVSAAGPLAEDIGLRPELVVADFSARARRRGLFDLLDPTVPWPDQAPAAHLTDDERRWLFARHPFLAALGDDEAAIAALAPARAPARAAVQGLRIVIDGSWHGGWEMGTQVQALALVDALARRADVARVGVALAAPPSPSAARVLGHPKVDARVALRDLTDLGPADVVHRPFQPDGALDVASWRTVGTRTVVTILDLIAYHVGAYFPSGAAWAAHRRGVRRTVAEVDGVVTISNDVAHRIRLERLPVQADRLFVVGLGTDHLAGDEPEAAPAGVDALGGRFLLVLGAGYSHKNRDLAVRAAAELRRRGHDLGIVLAGAAFGGDDVAGDGVMTLPHVAAAERNWLLRHADAVLYPSSAEGFGLVPYEAARFGTPTVLVPVGPLAGLAAHLPVVAVDWAPPTLAGATQALLEDPALAAEQVRATLAVAGSQTWDAAARGLVAVYRRLLARPPVGDA